MAHKMSHIKLFFILLLAGISFLSCSEDQDLINPTSTEGLSMGLQIGMPYDALQRDPATGTTPSNDVLKEDVINDMNVFFYTTDGTCVKHYFLDSKKGDNLASGQRTRLENGETWRGSFTSGTTYKVYAIANFGNDLGDNIALKDLHRTITDPKIYLPYNSSTNTNKSFLMDGKTDWIAPNNETYDVEIPIELRRAASKVIVNFTFSTEMQTKLTSIGSAKWGLKNYATITEMLQETTPSTYGLFTGATENDLGTPNKTSTNSFITYVYPNDWTDDPVVNQTLIQLDVPCTYTMDDNTTKSYDHNVYTLPVTDEGAIERNHIYTLNATLSKPSEHSDIHVDLKYNIKKYDWQTIDVNVGEGTDATFLYVQPATVIMKNVEEDNSVTYVSSSDVTVTIEKAYYNDKNGNEVNVSTTDYHISATPTGATNLRQGTIKFHSDVPTNLGPRYILVKITNTDGLSKEVLYKQYPLEYITAIQGYYSYRDNLNSYADVLSGNLNENTKFSTGSGINYSLFTSKVYKDNNGTNEVLFLSLDRQWIWTGWNDGYYQYTAKTSSVNPRAFNPNMYVVRITSTSNKYEVDKPLIKDGVTEGSDANSKVVSPAFMLASQLGAVSSTTWSNASEHCKKYIEVASNGTIYDDWRLPTLAELAIISQYQSASGQDVMTTVLAGEQYWSAFNDSKNSAGQYGYYTPASKGSTDGFKYTDGGSCYIRCIRDMKPSELTE